MSQANLDLLRRASALADAGDWDAVIALYDPDVEYRDLQHGPDMPEVLQGHAGIRRVVALWMDVYDEFRGVEGVGVSQENVEVAQLAIGAFNRSEVGAFAALTTPDFAWSPSMVAIEGEIFRGREGIERYFESLGNAWDQFLILPDRFRDPADLVIMLGRLEGRGKGSGVPVDASLGMVFDFRGGAISRIRGFLDHDEALRAAGAIDRSQRDAWI